MKLTQDVRDVASQQAEEAANGMAEMAAAFKDQGGELYVSADAKLS
jgi:hypothetical protein